MASLMAIMLVPTLTMALGEVTGRPLEDHTSPQPVLLNKSLLIPMGDEDYFVNGSDFPYAPECQGGASEAEILLYISLTFWVELIVQSVVGLVGFFANLIVIPILCGEKMKSIFNRLLASLVIFDNGYILLTLLETLRRNIGPPDFFNIVYCNFLYPLRNILLCCTIYMAIALALERYRAIRHPIQYHNANAGTNPWKKVFTNYLAPVVAFALVTNLPKFLEFQVVYKEITKELYDPQTKVMSKIRILQTDIAATDLRFNHEYVLWYKNVTRLLLTGLIPFVVLVYLNFSVFSVIRRRRHLEHRFINAQSTALKVEAAKQAYVLFAICTTFFFGHILRVVLNIHEFYTLDEVLDGIDNDCFTIQFWTLITGNISHLLLTLNSSINMLVYCLMSGDFRQIFIRQMDSIKSGFCCLCPNSGRDPDHSESTPTSTPVAAGHAHYATRLLEVTEAVEESCVPQSPSSSEDVTKFSMETKAPSGHGNQGPTVAELVAIRKPLRSSSSFFLLLHRFQSRLGSRLQSEDSWSSGDIAMVGLKKNQTYPGGKEKRPTSVRSAVTTMSETLTKQQRYQTQCPRGHLSRRSATCEHTMSE